MQRLWNVVRGFLGLLVAGGLALIVVLVLISRQSNPGAGPDVYDSPIRTASPLRPTAAPHQTATVPRSGPTLVPPPAATSLTPMHTLNTSTPRPGEIRPPDRSTPTPTSTPMPIIDLAQSVPDREKTVIIVQRSDGKREEYIVPRGPLEDGKSRLHLGPGDKIVLIYPFLPVRPPPNYWPTPVTPTSTTFVSPLPMPTTNAQP
jgi:hypothetical protein